MLFLNARQIVQNSGCVGLIFSKGIREWGAYAGNSTIPSGMISDCDHQKLRALVTAAKPPRLPVKAVLINPDTPSTRGYDIRSGEILSCSEKICNTISSHLP